VSTHYTDLSVRTYELDGFGHLNHATFLNYFEFARFEALRASGFPPDRLLAGGMGIHVVRVEVDYLREVQIDQRLSVSTTPAEIRNSSLTLVQEVLDSEDSGVVFARARVVLVWVGPNGRPTRIPDDVRVALAPRAVRSAEPE
jgi:YbgC/YbaW family acyl-CoA thioester hydrolase